MREFIDAYTFGNNAKLSFIVGGFYWAKGGMILCAWTQQRLVIKMDSNGQCDHMDVDVTAGLSLADEITVRIPVSFAYGGVQYCDITDVLRSVFDKSAKTTIADTGTKGIITITQRDVDDTQIDKPYECGFIYYDAIVMSPVKALQPTAYRLLPDTFRLPISLVSLIPQACTRMTQESAIIRLLDSAGVVVDSVTSAKDQQTYGWGFVHLGEVAEVHVMDAGGGIVERAHVVWDNDCNQDRVLLTWWSPVFGGWKSVLADVLRHSDDVSETQDYLQYFDYRQAKGGSLGWNVRIPNCTSRDYEYYRDIYLSDNVFVHDLIIYTSSNDTRNVRHTVKVSGTPPEVPVNGTTNLNLKITMQEVSSIW